MEKEKITMTTNKQETMIDKHRSIPDYTGDGFWARELAKKVQSYYHERGYTDVRCWVEPELNPVSGKKMWGVRSNILFSI